MSRKYDADSYLQRERRRKSRRDTIKGLSGSCFRVPTTSRANRRASRVARASTSPGRGEGSASPGPWFRNGTQRQILLTRSTHGLRIAPQAMRSAEYKPYRFKTLLYNGKYFKQVCKFISICKRETFMNGDRSQRLEPYSFYIRL